MVKTGVDSGVAKGTVYLAADTKEELFYQATDQRCTEDYCAENLRDTRALRADGKFVLGVDYASRPDDVRAACAAYATEHFAGTVTVLDLDRTSPPCPGRGA